jgi:Rap1a immunity proteins
MRIHAIGIAAALALLAQQGSALAQSQLHGGSANNAMQGCRELVNQSNRHTQLQRECASTVRTMIYVAASRGICPPDGATVGHAVRVIVAYIDQRLERMDEQFEALAIEALQQAWPCRR